MGAQTNYHYSTPQGVAGGLFDLSDYAINTRLNGETVGTLLCGMGVVQGVKPGSDIALPTTAATVEKFEGVVMNGFSNQQDLEGDLKLPHNQAVGVMTHGKAWVRVGASATPAPAYGEELYLIVSGEEAGYFTTASDGSATIVAVPGRFIGSKDGSSGIAPARFYNQK